jgi:tether containing UBX domain for GLUT4
MYKLEQARAITDVTIQLQLPDASRYVGSFNPSTTLQDMLKWYRAQPESMVAALDVSIDTTNDLHPVCSYMSEEVIGEYALANTTLRELGLTSGTAVIR